MIARLNHFTPPTLHAQTASALCADNLNFLGNYAKSIFWRAEQNVHYTFLPIHQNHLGQSENKLIEIAKRLLIGPPALAITLLLAPFAILGHVSTALSHALQSKEFVYLEGLYEEISKDTLKIMHLNTCMLPGGLTYLFGGMRTAGERFNDLMHLIKFEDPDIVFLSEFSETLTPRLYESLKHLYKHFFVNIGSNAFGMDASLCVLCKIPLAKEPRFIPSLVEAAGTQRLMYRGYFILETRIRSRGRRGHHTSQS